MTVFNAAGVYVIRHRDGREYIGSSANIAGRLRAHRWALRCGKHHSPTLQRSWAKHGEVAFEFALLEACPAENRLAREQFYIDAREPYYNHAPVAGTTEGYKFTREQRRQLAVARGLTLYEYEDRECTLSEIAQRSGQSVQRLWRRIVQQGLPLEEAVSRTSTQARAVAARKQWAEPAQRDARRASISRAQSGRSNTKRLKQYPLHGKSVTIFDLMAITGAPRGRLQTRLSAGMCAEDVVKYASHRCLRDVPDLAEKYAAIARENVRTRRAPVMTEEGRERQRAAVRKYNETREVSQETRVKMASARRAKAARYLVRGEMLSVAEMSARWGVERAVVGHRIRAGWDVEKAATTPARKKQRTA